MDMLDKRMIDLPDRTECDFIKLLRMAHNLKHKVFNSGIFHLIFSNCGLLWITETTENKTTNKSGLLYIYTNILTYYMCACMWEGNLKF